MKKHAFILLFLLTVIFEANSQLGNLMVKKSDKGLYIDHKVVAKEGLYSIGRIYYVHPHHLAAFNNMDGEKGLNLGQVLRIPLTDTNFNQKTSEGLPVYYVVSAGDGLSAISRVHNRVPIDRLRTWNNLQTDNISKDSRLIIGYLSMVPPASMAKNTQTEPVREPVSEKEKPISTESVKTEKETVPPQVEAVSEQPAKALKEEAQPAAKIEEVVPPPTTRNSETNSGPRWTGTGFFKPYFEQQVKESPISKNETVTSGVFKTTSGWQDGKFYLLIDNVPTGSIVRIVNPENNKAVFAKVLGQMNGIRQNEGLGIRISNAAASALEVGTSEKFVVQVSF